MYQASQCPACGAPRYASSTWCAYCGFIFPTASTPGGWQIGRIPRPLPPELLAPTGTQSAAAAPSVSTAPAPMPVPPSWPTPHGWQAPPAGWQAPPPAWQPPPPAWQPAAWPPQHAWSPPAQIPPTPTPPPGATPDLASRRVPALIAGIAAILGVVVAVAVVASSASFSAATPRPTAQVIAEATPSPKPTAAPSPTATATPVRDGVVRHVNGHIEFGDGTYGVGALPPGTYRTLDATNLCFWERTVVPAPGVTDSLTGTLSDSSGTAVTIYPEDARFTSLGCGTWSNDLQPITTSRTIFDDGEYIVGVDIAPGTYVSEGFRQCFWQRLSGFGNSPDETLQSVYVGGDGAQRVVIKPTDKGFRSSACGTWTRK